MSKPNRAIARFGCDTHRGPVASSSAVDADRPEIGLRLKGLGSEALVANVIPGRSLMTHVRNGLPDRLCYLLRTTGYLVQARPLLGIHVGNTGTQSQYEERLRA